MGQVSAAAAGLHRFDRLLIHPEQVTGTTLLGVCASLKPGPGREARSAVRALLSHALATVSSLYPKVLLLDLRQHPLPLYDGRLPDEWEDPAVAAVASSIRRAGALLLGVPAYWSGVSGVFKNLIDLLCGPAYDQGGGLATLLTGKPIAFFVVGADEESAHWGAQDATRILASTGAHLIESPLALTNPRVARDEDASTVLAGLIAQAATLARYCVAIHKEAP